MKQLLTWGLSMYEGYYAEVIINDRVEGYHTDKLKELRELMGELGLTLDKMKRFDN